MSKREELIKIIDELGFDEKAEIPSTDIIFKSYVFDECARNTCGNYGKNYACPPLSGTMQENMDRMLKYKNAIVVDKLVRMKTAEEMKQGMEDIKNLIKNLRKKTEDLGVFVAGPGGCTVCEKCAAIDNEPCRFPDKTQYSMEGSGMDLVSLSRKIGLTYNGGERGIGYFFMVLYND